jgi:N-acetyl-anhydromuramyl-L-alanine amidase AmpD
VGGYNSNTLGFCYSGGLDENGKPADTRTPEQIELMMAVAEVTRDAFLILNEQITVNKGHRDFSPDRNGDGYISPSEWTKACPCFDVKTKIEDKL